MARFKTILTLVAVILVALVALAAITAIYAAFFYLLILAVVCVVGVVAFRVFVKSEPRQIDRGDGQIELRKVDRILDEYKSKQRLK